MDFNLVDMVVRHVTKGEGIIKDDQGKRISVFFSQTGETMNFLFPDAFIKKEKFLTAVSTELSDYIQELHDEMSTCVLCKSVFSFPDLLDKNRLCTDCAAHSVRCVRCRGIVDSRNSTYITCRLCQTCFEESYFVCSVCGKICGKESLVNGQFVPNNEMWCSDCAHEKGFVLCDNCNKYCSISEAIEYNFGTMLCNTCQDKLIRCCKECHEQYFSFDEEPDEGLCNDCQREVNYVTSISAVDWSSLKVEIMSTYQLQHAKTLELMTRLRRTKETVAICATRGIEIDYSDVLLIKAFSKALVVIHGSPFPVQDVPVYYDSTTMTNFKKNGVAHNLLAQSHPLLSTIKWPDEGILELWKAPFLLKAQTEYDRDYKKIWRNGWLEYEGNNYGDTSNFYIIGVLNCSS